MYNDLDRLGTEIAAALMGLDAQQTQAAPAVPAGKWTIQQIVEHLCLTYRASVPAIRTRLDKGTPTRAVASLQQRLGQFFLITLGLFPRGREAPAVVLPPDPTVPLSGADLTTRVQAELKQLDDVTSHAERVFGAVRAASHMILGPLSIAQWRRFHLIHGRHHLKQIRRIRRERGF